MKQIIISHPGWIIVSGKPVRTIRFGVKSPFGLSGFQTASDSSKIIDKLLTSHFNKYAMDLLSTYCVENKMVYPLLSV